MNYLMLLPLMISVAIILFLLSTLNKEESESAQGEQTSNTLLNNRHEGTPCYEKIREGNKRNPNDYVDFSGGNMGI